MLGGTESNRDLMRRSKASLLLSAAALPIFLAPRFAETQTQSLAPVELNRGEEVYIGHLMLGPVPGAPFEGPVFRPCDREQRYWVPQWSIESMNMLVSFYEREGLSRVSEVFVVFSAYETDDFLREPSPIYVGGFGGARLLAIRATVSERRCG